jgi:hypothetical protein
VGLSVPWRPTGRSALRIKCALSRFVSRENHSLRVTLYLSMKSRSIINAEAYALSIRRIAACDSINLILDTSPIFV